MAANSSKRIVGPSFRWLETPVVNETRCVGSATCVDVCPTECLEMDGPMPWLPRPEECVSCSLCVYICPVSALTLKKIEPP